jgi:lipopolysaccharide/colanic/teichoic acid biosynthesis glycosyltransferase
MSLIGPRPLLPHDQPPDAELRLMVRPGITGWAQVNGGKAISAEKKKQLDEWYIRNASFGLDLRILIMTVRFIVTGERSTVTNERVAEEPESTPVPAVATNRIGIE